MLHHNIRKALSSVSKYLFLWPWVLSLGMVHLLYFSAYFEKFQAFPVEKIPFLGTLHSEIAAQSLVTSCMQLVILWQITLLIFLKIKKKSFSLPNK